MLNTKTPKYCALIAAMLAIPVGGFAGTGTPAKESKSVVEKTKESCITGDLGVDVYSQYIFHGLTLENQGAIIQPYADLYFKLYSGDGFLNAATLNLSIWNSFHSNHPSGSTTRSWYEFDFLAGVSLNFAKHFTFTPSYVYYGSPGDYFANSHNLRLQLSVDDKDWLGAFSLQPYVLVEFELEGKGGNGVDQGIYYEVGISPGTTVGDLAINVPIKAGFGSNDYYSRDSGFGFLSAGLAFAYSMKFIPECYGDWSLSAGATYFYYGDPNKDATAIKGSNRNDFVFNGGLKIAF